jgi:streptogramin lyase
VDLLQGSVGAVAVTPDGIVWGVTGEHDLVRFDGQSWTFQAAAEGPSLDGISVLAVAPDGALWVGGGGGAARFDGETWTVYTSAEGLAGETVHAIAFAPDGAIWFGTRNGAVLFRPSEAAAQVVCGKIKMSSEMFAV